MNAKASMLRTMTIAVTIIFVLISCSVFTPGDGGEAPDVATATPTPTPAVAQNVDEPEVEESVCAGLTGQLIVEVLIGPAEAVGLEPFEIAVIDFSVSADEPYTVQGSGASSSPPQVLAEEWGTYTVTFDMNFNVSGTCDDTGAGMLHLTIDMTGEQLVVVEAQDFHGEYPWSGSNTFVFDFPLINGTTFSGEGWQITLIL